MLAECFAVMAQGDHGRASCTEKRPVSHEFDPLSSLQDGIKDRIEGELGPTSPDHERGNAHNEQVHEQEQHLTNKDRGPLLARDTSPPSHPARAAHRRGHQKVLQQAA